MLRLNALVLLVLTSCALQVEAGPKVFGSDHGKSSHGTVKGIKGVETYVELGGHEYYFPPDDVYEWVPWLEAANICKNLGMKLITYDTEEKNTLIKNYVKDNGWGNTPFWSSGIKFSGTWIWTAGSVEEIQIFDWAQDEPNDLMDCNSCIQVFGDRGWDDTWCQYSRSYICE